VSELTPPRSTSLLRKIGDALADNRFSRRGFFTRVAVVGSALSLDPISFATKPASAYDAVCGTDADCAAGYTVFCCTINNGGNFCPDGSFLGGWWKADNSGFCCGGPRYYLDCNVSCGVSYSCGCETSPDTCDNRKIACNQFRYGQCNLEIDCYGPVLCRVITCTPPWVFDSSCTSSSATDQNTASHTAPCLPGQCPDPLTLHYYDLGGPGGAYGPEVAGVQTLPWGTWLQLAHGALFDVYPAGFTSTFGALYANYLALGGPMAVGVPYSNDKVCVDGVGQYNIYDRVEGSASNPTLNYWNPNLGSGSVTGKTLELFNLQDNETGPFGYPVSNRTHTSDGTGVYTNFSKETGGSIREGRIYQNAVAGTFGIYGTIFEHYVALRAHNGPLGYPTSLPQAVGGGQKGHFATFAKIVDRQSDYEAAIYFNPATGTWSVLGPILDKWRSLGAETGELGFPTSDQQTTTDALADYNTFATVAGDTPTGYSAIYLKGGVAYAVIGAFYSRWSSLNREAGPLGYPTGDVTSETAGSTPYTQQLFETGAIYGSQYRAAAALSGGLYTKYIAQGGPAGSLGLPLTSEFTSGGVTSATFQNGTLSSP
jgi:uncharacterized protein with LGFP repeats